MEIHFLKYLYNNLDFASWPVSLYYLLFGDL